MQQATTDKAYFTEYMGNIETGATEAEAVMQVATSNEVSCSIVFEALLRQGLLHPCGLCDSYRY